MPVTKRKTTKNPKELLTLDADSCYRITKQTAPKNQVSGVNVGEATEGKAMWVEGTNMLKVYNVKTYIRTSPLIKAKEYGDNKWLCYTLNKSTYLLEKLNHKS